MDRICHLTIEHLTIEHLTINGDLKDLGIKVWGVDHASKSYPSPHHNPADDPVYKRAVEENNRYKGCPECASTNQRSYDLQKQLVEVLEWAASLCPHLGLTPLIPN
ncbi:hypothetical protein NHP190012_16660 (plasmid) [Helicobacter sp. NHP19-012]|uniref:Uncharacterized protein n=1 Tax=Helicobacter gastrofelis TaxID=2849642 RepID=A0ABN6IBE4_9HELI|nr:hypothetical protein [Helicobacter sp. NHP19-012]BCZ20024.1 hypothetical protein NHP190012_16660 [Helicobacter sp. NHP19-012]